MALYNQGPLYAFIPAGYTTGFRRSLFPDIIPMGPIRCPDKCLLHDPHAAPYMRTMCSSYQPPLWALVLKRLSRVDKLSFQWFCGGQPWDLSPGPVVTKTRKWLPICGPWYTQNPDLIPYNFHSGTPRGFNDRYSPGIIIIEGILIIY